MAVVERYRFAHLDGSPYHRNHDSCARHELLDWIGPALFAVGSSGAASTVEKWEPEVMRRLGAQSAEHVLMCFEAEYPNDDRPGLAVAAALRRVDLLAFGMRAGHPSRAARPCTALVTGLLDKAPPLGL